MFHASGLASCLSRNDQHKDIGLPVSSVSVSRDNESAESRRYLDDFQDSVDSFVSIGSRPGVCGSSRGMRPASARCLQVVVFAQKQSAQLFCRTSHNSCILV